MTAGGTDADPQTGGVVVISELRMPVEGELIVYAVDDVTVWQASAAPEVRFDTSGLGPDLSFTVGRPSQESLAGVRGDVVYLGEFGGVPMILYGAEAPTRNPWDYIYEFVMGHGDRRLLDASFPCCASTEGDPGIWRGWPWTEQAIAQWLGTPPSTSVVAFEVDGQPVGFQRPVGGIVSLPVSAPLPYMVSFIAYDSAGTVLTSRDLPVVPFTEPPDAVDTLTRIDSLHRFW